MRILLKRIKLNAGYIIVRSAYTQLYMTFSDHAFKNFSTTLTCINFLSTLSLTKKQSVQLVCYNSIYDTNVRLHMITTDNLLCLSC